MTGYQLYTGYQALSGEQNVFGLRKIYMISLTFEESINLLNILPKTLLNILIENMNMLIGICYIFISTYKFRFYGSK